MSAILTAAVGAYLQVFIITPEVSRLSPSIRSSRYACSKIVTSFATSGWLSKIDSTHDFGTEKSMLHFLPTLSDVKRISDTSERNGNLRDVSSSTAQISNWLFPESNIDIYDKLSCLTVFISLPLVTFFLTMSKDSRDSCYMPLPTGDPTVDEERSDGDIITSIVHRSWWSKTSILVYRGVIILQSTIILIFVIYNQSRYFKSGEGTCSQVVYCTHHLCLCIHPHSCWSYSLLLLAPAQHLVEYHPVLFGHGLGKMTTIYQHPPSETVDKAWTDLYDGMSPLWFGV